MDTVAGDRSLDSLWLLGRIPPFPLDFMDMDIKAWQ